MQPDRIIRQTIENLKIAHPELLEDDEAWAAYYSAERRAGACPLVANERMSFFADRLDDLEFQRDLEIIKSILERRS